jgi:hypothetical protein
VIREHLAPGGLLYLAEQPLSPHVVDELASHLRRLLEGNRYRQTDLRTASDPPRICAVAEPAQ